LPSGKTIQRTILYLGEINNQQQAAWRKTLSVFDEERQDFPADAVDSLQRPPDSKALNWIR
jgi:hypothetical protein